MLYHTIVFLSALNICVCENCLFYNNTVDCSKSKIKSVIIDIPVSHGTKVLILEGQPLENISNNTFKNVGNLEILNLKNCKINFIHRYTFKYMPNLQDLDLSYNEIISLDKNIFRQNLKLKKIFLNNNNLYIIKNYTFSSQNLLSHLYLQNNFLLNLTKEAFPKYLSLKLLNLTRNKISFLDSEIIENSEYLYEIYIDENEFICDCHMQKLYQILKKRQLYSINSRCSDPKPLKNVVFMELNDNDFTCPIEIQSDKYIITYKNSFTLICNVTSETEPNLLWNYKNETIFDNKKYLITKKSVNNMLQYMLTINNLTKYDTGLYKCLAINTGFTNESQIYFLFKHSEKPLILAPNTNIISVDLHEYNYTIPFKIFGAPKPKVFWTYNTKILNENSTFDNVFYNESYIQNDTYWFNVTIRKVKLKYRTLFSCNATNTEGSTQKNVTLKILYPKKVTFWPTQNFTQINELENVNVICALQAVPKPNIIWKYRHLKIDDKISPKYQIHQYRDYDGTYWNTLTILKIEMIESGQYRCEANNSEEILTKIFTIQVNKVEEKSCGNSIMATVFIAIGCILLIILSGLIVCKCCIRYHVSKNWTQEYSFRASMLR